MEMVMVNNQTRETQEKLTDFVKLEYHKLVNYVRKRLDDSADQSAEDIVQDVMLNIYAKADITEPIENLSAYIYQSLRNKIIDGFRKKRNDVSLDQTMDPKKQLYLKDILHDKRYEVVPELEKKEMMNKLYQAIDKLKPKERALIIATEFDDCSFRDLAEEWDEPIGTLLARKSRALEKIKKLMNVSL